MRADMGKVLVERPRPGSRDGSRPRKGYRKALRAMKVAEKFHRPIFTFVDTPGAYPGLGAEERGQAEAIAHNLREMARLKVKYTRQPLLTSRSCQQQGHKQKARDRFDAFRSGGSGVSTPI